MRRPPSAVLGVLLTVIALLLCVQYVRAWQGLPPVRATTSDFAGTYASATLWRTGHGDEVYDIPAEEAVLAATGTPHDHLLIPFENPPAAAVLASPLSLLNSVLAYRIWSTLQLLLVLIAAGVVVRVAPWPRRRSTYLRAAAAVIGVAGFGTALLLIEGQWDGVAALGLAVAYAGWRRGGSMSAGLVFGFTAAIAKPHLAIGVVCFMLGRRDWRTLAGAALGAACSLAFAEVTVGSAGVAAFVHAVLSPSYSPVLQMQNAGGLVASWLGQSTLSFDLGLLLSVAGFAAAAVIGSRSRGRPDALEPALFAATALSLFAAPHLLGHDLTLLVPPFVALLAWQARGEGVGWPGRGSLAVIGCWAALGLAAHQDVAQSLVGPPGRLTPVVLLLLAAVGVAGMRLRPLHEANPPALRLSRAVARNDADVAVRLEHAQLHH